MVWPTAGLLSGLSRSRRAGAPEPAPVSPHNTYSPFDSWPEQPGCGCSVGHAAGPGVDPTGKCRRARASRTVASRRTWRGTGAGIGWCSRSILAATGRSARAQVLRRPVAQLTAAGDVDRAVDRLLLTPYGRVVGVPVFQPLRDLLRRPVLFEPFQHEPQQLATRGQP